MLRPLLVAALLVSLAEPLRAQPPAGEPPQGGGDPDTRVDLLQPDFTLIALPTTLRLPSGKWAFRVTHRFTRDLTEGDLGDQLSNLFGLDGGSLVGLELRYGLRPGTQVSLHRTSDKAIQLLAQQSLIDEADDGRFGLDAVATIEGADNLSEHVRGVIGALFSKRLTRAAVYAEPMVVLNANPLDVGDEHTLVLGLGGRVRVSESLYLVTDFTPRLAGYSPDAHQVSFGVESRRGGHLFQVTVSNGFGTTFGQLARGGRAYDQWFLGFNISRKFYRPAR
jgi:hypothetical protein